MLAHFSGFRMTLGKKCTNLAHFFLKFQMKGVNHHESVCSANRV